MAEPISFQASGSDVVYNGKIVIRGKSPDAARRVTENLNKAVKHETISTTHQDNRKMIVMTGGLTLFTANDLKETIRDEEKWKEVCADTLPKIFLVQGMPTSQDGINREIKRLKDSLNGRFLDLIPYSAVQDISQQLGTKYKLADLYFQNQDVDEALKLCEEIFKSERINSDYYYEAIFLKTQILRHKADKGDLSKIDEAISDLEKIVNPGNKHANYGYKLRALLELGKMHLIKFNKNIIPDLNKDTLTNEEEVIAYIERIRSFYEWALELGQDAIISPNINDHYSPALSNSEIEHRDLSFFRNLEYRKNSGDIYAAAAIMLAMGDLFTVAKESEKITSSENKLKYSKLADQWYKLLIFSPQFNSTFFYKTIQKPEYFYGLKAKAYLGLFNGKISGGDFNSLAQASLYLKNAIDLISKFKTLDTGYFYFQNYEERSRYFEIKIKIVEEFIPELEKYFARTNVPEINIKSIKDIFGYYGITGPINAKAVAKAKAVITASIQAEIAFKPATIKMK